MTLEEIDFVKIQKKTAGSFMITIPAQAVKDLGIHDNERMKVFLDKENHRLVYELQQPSKKK